jgi:hypothetical protein
MINVVCAHVGNYCDRGTEYVQRLFDGIDKHLYTYRPWCITDNPAMIPDGIRTIEADPCVQGWWNKISLFRPGILPKGERVLYFDLDTIIKGDLSDIANYRGKFAMLRDFYFKGNLNSGLMAWEAGTMDHLWRVWDRCGRPQYHPGGDQAWIEEIQETADLWQDLIPNQIFSWKTECRDGVPSNARVICFHGQPRPHETELWSSTDDTTGRVRALSGNLPEEVFEGKQARG